MTKRMRYLFLALACSAAWYGTSRAQAQGIAQPLTIQGLDQTYVAGVRARAMGGAVTARAGDEEALFWNPAGLAGVERLTVSASGAAQATGWAESQRWNPNRYYAGLSLYFQNPEAYAYEPFERPDWTNTARVFRPGHAAVVLPFALGGRPAAVAAAAHQVVDLTDYDRNDNVLDPYIGNFRPEPVPRPTPSDSVTAIWSGFERERTGALYALTAGGAAEVLPRLRVGVRLSYWTGSSDDRERRYNRGRFVFFETAHLFDAYDLSGSTTWTGTSEYTAFTGALGLHLTQDAFTLGLTIQAPTTVTRDWTRDVDVVDPAGARSRRSESGRDEVTLPVAVTVGGMLRPSASLALAADYQYQNFEAMDVDAAGSAEVFPAWYAAHGVRLGLEWRATRRIAVRAGYREDPRPFRIEGAGIVEETARGSVYSAGLGFDGAAFRFDLTYEYHYLLYFDRWESNVNHARTVTHRLLAGVTWRL